MLDLGQDQIRNVSYRYDRIDGYFSKRRILRPYVAPLYNDDDENDDGGSSASGSSSKVGNCKLGLTEKETSTICGRTGPTLMNSELKYLKKRRLLRWIYDK
jgi:hypothetical protein